MSFNLIHDAWIPIRRKDETRQRIRPWEITDRIDTNPIIALDAPRPDFNGALIQFLIGLIQTAMPPKDEREWRALFQKPPPPDSLRAAFDPFSHAFNLDGDGPRFMQDLKLKEGESKNIATLLIETPGDQTIRNNTDHFIKRNGISKICMTCTANALLALQINAPAGGQGHRTSLRGGGPLTTLVADADSLWKTVWLNILEGKTFDCPGSSLSKNQNTYIFPWLDATRTSESKTGRTTTPEDVHPIQVFWGMPRRIRLLFSKETTGTCDICNQEKTRLLKYFITKNYGINYEGPWLHPLTPHSLDKDLFPLPRKGQPGGITYRHWLGLVQDDDKKNSSPAANVTVFKKERYRKTNYRLWTFGYDMDNMKARCWYESEMPLILVDENIRKDYESLAAGLVRAAEEVAYTMRSCLKKAWFNRPGDVKGNFSFIDAQFWQSTEPEFYKTLEWSRDLLPNGEDTTELKRQWLRTLADTAEEIFDSLSQNGQFDAADPKRIALAWRDLKKFTSESNKKLRDILLLPKPEGKTQEPPLKT